MISYKAAAIQMNSQPDLDLNLENTYKLVGKASAAGALFVGLPENFAWLGDLHGRIEHAEKIADRIPDFLKELSAQFNVYLLGGGFPVPASEKKVYNRSILVSPDQSVLATYDKIHLFDVELSDKESYRESDIVQSGDGDAIVYSSGELGNIGLSICYDLRFPELYRKMADKGADLLNVPSAFTATTGKDHWEPLIRARAIENTCYLFAPAQTGRHGKKRNTHGHAMIVDPWGKILADAGEKPGMALATIEKSVLEKVRRKIPSLEHRMLR